MSVLSWQGPLYGVSRNGVFDIIPPQRPSKHALGEKISRYYLVLAGDKAKNAYANQTALDFYARALAVVPRVEPSLPTRRIIEIYQRRGQVYLLLSRYPDAIAEAERMRENARAAGDRWSEGEAL